MFGTKIKLEKELYQRCCDHARTAGYSSVDEFVTHVLEKTLQQPNKPPNTDRDVEKQLRGLGYIE